MSEHTYQREIASEQQLEDTLEAPGAVNPQAAPPEKGRNRVGPAVLEVLQHAKKALTPQQVHEKRPELSEQQINAAIQNLYKKGAGKLERSRQGRSFAYSVKPERVKQRSRGRATAPMALPQKSPIAGMATAGPVQEAVAPVTEQLHGESQVQRQERQPLNVTVSMDGHFVITKDGQTISLDTSEREQFLSFVRRFVS